MKTVKNIVLSAVILAAPSFSYADSTYHTLGETRGTHVMHTKGQTLDDSRINTAVSNLLATDPELAHYKIRSFVNEAVVTLSGTVTTAQEFAKTIKLTKSVSGV